MSSEEVLVFPRTLLTELGDFDGASADVGRYLEVLFRPESVELVPRAEAETNPAFKQLIPYVVLRFADELFLYKRGSASSEGRLIDRYSIGLGGHINADDLRHGWSRSAYLAATRREVFEEVHVNTAYSEQIIGLLNMERDEVGRVHFGVVHVWTLSQPRIVCREAQILQGAFAAIGAIRKQVGLEEWSAAALTLL